MGGPVRPFGGTFGRALPVASVGFTRISYYHMMQIMSSTPCFVNRAARTADAVRRGRGHTGGLRLGRRWNGARADA